jgi:hypothetical protein
MRNHVTHACAALAIAAVAAACGGRTSQVADRHDKTAGTRGVNERVVLRGCVQPAVQGGGYALRHVMVLPPAEQPQGQDTIDHPLIPKGSWVRLAGGQDMTDTFKKHLNNEVSVTGDIVNSGENTIGTAGRGGSAQAQDPSQTGVANGDAPSVAVEKLEKIAENCAGE